MAAKLFPLLLFETFFMTVALSYDWQNGSIPLVQHWTEWRNVASILFYSSLALAVAYSWLRRKVSPSHSREALYFTFPLFFMSRKKKERKKGKGVDGLLMTAHQQSQLLLVQPNCCSCRQVLCCALVVVIRLNHPSIHWVCGWVVWRSLLATRRGRKGKH